jgi:hypothetical protein
MRLYRVEGDRTRAKAVANDRRRQETVHGIGAHGHSFFFPPNTRERPEKQPLRGRLATGERGNCFSSMTDTPL